MDPRLSFKKMSSHDSLAQLVANFISRNFEHAAFSIQQLKGLPVAALQPLLPYLSGRKFHELNKVFVSGGINTDPWWRKHLMKRWSKIHNHNAEPLCQNFLKEDGSCPHRLYMESHFHDVLYEFLNDKRICTGKYHLGNRHPNLFDVPLKQFPYFGCLDLETSQTGWKFEDIYSLCSNVYCLSLSANMCDAILLHKKLIRLLSMSVICLSLVQVRSNNITSCKKFIEYLQTNGTLKCLYVDCWSSLCVQLSEVDEFFKCCAHQVPVCQTLEKDSYHCDKDEYSEESVDSKEFTENSSESSSTLVPSTSREATESSHKEIGSFDLFDEAVVGADVAGEETFSQLCSCATTGIRVFRVNLAYHFPCVSAFKKVLKTFDYSIQNWFSLESLIFSTHKPLLFLDSFVHAEYPTSETEEDRETVCCCLLTAIKEHRLCRVDLDAEVVLPGLFQSILCSFESHYRVSNGHKPMKSLSLTQTTVTTEDSPQCLLKTFESNELLSAVERLDMSEYHFGVSDYNGLLWLLRHDTSLTRLILRDCCFTPEDTITLLRILTDFHQLQEFDISGSSLSEDSVLATLLQFLDASSSLKVLSVQETDIPGDFLCGSEFIRYVKQSQNFECINLKGNHLGKKAVEWIWKVFDCGNPTLKSINISENAIRSQHLQEFIDRMKPIHERRKKYLLSMLDITLNEVYGSGILACDSDELRSDLKFVKSLRINPFPCADYHFNPLVDHLAQM